MRSLFGWTYVKQKCSRFLLSLPDLLIGSSLFTLSFISILESSLDRLSVLRISSLSLGCEYVFLLLPVSVSREKTLPGLRYSIGKVFSAFRTDPAAKS